MLVFEGGDGGVVGKDQPPSKTSIRAVLFPPPPFPLGLQWTPVDSTGLTDKSEI